MTRKEIIVYVLCTEKAIRTYENNTKITIIISLDEYFYNYALSKMLQEHNRSGKNLKVKYI